MQHCRPEALQIQVSKRELDHSGGSLGGEAVALLLGRDGVTEDAEPSIVDPRIRIQRGQSQAHGPDECASRLLDQQEKECRTVRKV